MNDELLKKLGKEMLVRGMDNRTFLTLLFMRKDSLLEDVLNATTSYEITKLIIEMWIKYNNLQNVDTDILTEYYMWDFPSIFIKIVNEDAFVVFHEDGSCKRLKKESVLPFLSNKQIKRIKEGKVCHTHNDTLITMIGNM